MGNRMMEANESGGCERGLKGGYKTKGKGVGKKRKGL